MASIGDKIDELHALREKKRALDIEVKAVREEMEEVEAELLDLMDDQKTRRGEGSEASVSISSGVYPAVEDWDKFYEFIENHRYFHLLERRPAVQACRELFEHTGQIPGVVPFHKRKLNLRTKQS